MKLHFETSEFDIQFLRVLQQVIYGGADIGECFATAKRIKDDDIDGWCEEWVATADMTAKEGEQSEVNHHFVSTVSAYLRASNYYRASMFFLYATPDDPRFLDAFERHVELFEKTFPYLPYAVQPLEIPFEDKLLPGYLYKADNSGSPRPTVIVNNGYDGTQQECYCTTVVALLQRGYHVVTFDGPGQGAALIKQGLKMRYEWDRVITAVYDCIAGKCIVDHDRIVLLGISWGGMLAAIAASKEKRLAALITIPGQWDALLSLRRFSPEIIEIVEKGDSQELTTTVARLLNNETVALKFRARMYIHGCQSAVELVKEWRHYHLHHLAGKIECPTLVVDTENEKLSIGQAKKFYEALHCPKEYVLFTNERGAGEHCCAGALTMLHQKTFDWLDKTIAQLSLTRI